MARFSRPNSIKIACLYILIACIRLSNSFSFLANSLMYIRWVIFSGDLVSLFPPVHFLSRWLSVIIAITNNNDHSASLRKIHLSISTSSKDLPPVVYSNLKFSIVLKTDFIISSCFIIIIHSLKLFTSALVDGF